MEVPLRAVARNRTLWKMTVEVVATVATQRTHRLLVLCRVPVVAALPVRKRKPMIPSTPCFAVMMVAAVQRRGQVGVARRVGQSGTQMPVAVAMIGANTCPRCAAS